MADYDSESSGAGDIETNVLLGYASKEPTIDNFSQLGGHPTWLDAQTRPDGSLAKCKVCNGYLGLLLQLYADVPERFPGHERRLYIWACRRKACRRKSGSIRGFRSVRYTASAASNAVKPALAEPTFTEPASAKPTVNLGDTLFGVKSPTDAQVNPFALSKQPQGAGSNPFARLPTQVSSSVQRPSDTNSLSETFAQKARISNPSSSVQSEPVTTPYEKWPEESSFPDPYPAYHIDADKEYLEPDSQVVPSNARLDRSAADAEGSGSAAEDRAAFESSMDKTFQRFADRIAQNPEQVLRYEYSGQPLLYSRKDAVGKLLDPVQASSGGRVQVVSSHASSGGAPRMPKCENCGAGRTFELQLTPHAITQLEIDEMGIDGMDWGTILLAVCSADCQERSTKDGEVSYLEEWVGVQWEELAGKAP
ncbi:hypothetical protein LTR02_004120 [Friedmanniomyces endolithicus]|nr:hypothetical protein LTR94_012007 [Friedmanniomyces endolithicus]KAK0777592.1 hypothetical protein LTR75_015910 [Friedmanniomyces endolithicus]KAK0794224.1 hypothetical protein LTR59_007869 [Friedmanniomyces endolithicus]KAK0811135.1 hypothetical protein LTR38_003740 [Friedmanniomyces endolithicus]KAK0834321.1 hypothetical protein LTR03_014419 [Friedmanniomyces endolithicus]